MSWDNSIYVCHVAIEGIATASVIQDNAADTLLDILCHHEILHGFKWVNDIVIFRLPVRSIKSTVDNSQFFYNFDLQSVFQITTPLGVPWHPIEGKGQDFSWPVKYVGFLWDLKN